MVPKVAVSAEFAPCGIGHDPGAAESGALRSHYVKGLPDPNQQTIGASRRDSRPQPSRAAVFERPREWPAVFQCADNGVARPQPFGQGSSMALRLYFHPLSSFCHKVLIALCENETRLREIVDLRDEAQRSAFVACGRWARFLCCATKAVWFQKLRS